MNLPLLVISRAGYPARERTCLRPAIGVEVWTAVERVKPGGVRMCLFDVAARVISGLYGEAGEPEPPPRPDPPAPERPRRRADRYPGPVPPEPWPVPEPYEW